MSFLAGFLLGLIVGGFGVGYCYIEQYRKHGRLPGVVGDRDL